MKIISVEENSATIAMMTEMLFNKEARLYKTAEDFEMCEIKNSDIKIALMNIDKVIGNRKNKIVYNTQVFKNLWQSNNLNVKNIIQLHDLNIFM